jgi:trehalose/maltose transport system substrate-binding protein
LTTLLAATLTLLTGTAAQAPAQTAGEPVTLTLTDGELAVKERHSVPDADLEEFTKQTGIQVKRVLGPEGTLNQLALWRDSLRGVGRSADVYSIDVIWSPMLADYLADLGSQISSEEKAEFDPKVLAAYTVEGKVVAVPYRLLFGVLLYRKDLLRRYGYGAPPKTWDELEVMAARIQQGERARGERDFWGFVWQGAETEGLTCNALEWQISEGGGRIIEDDKTVSVNNPRAVRAWQRAARWVGTISPPGVVAYREWDTVNVWSEGRAAFLRTWESDRLFFDWTDTSKLKVRGVLSGESIGVSRLPGGRSGRAGTVGGTGLGVARASPRPREALALVHFLSRRRIEKRKASEWRLGSEPPEVFDLPALLTPASPPGSERPLIELVARPSTVAGSAYEAVSKAFFHAVHSVLTGEKSASSVAPALEKDLLAITGFEKSRPRRD